MTKFRTMPVRESCKVLPAAGALACVGLVVLVAWPAAAQGSPFGVGAPPATAAPTFDPVVGWILAREAAFYQLLAAALRAARTDGSALAGLLSISFAYGIFHAAGPGHGKAVISSYLIATGETWRRGVVLSFVSALLQALTAIAIVTVAAVMLDATAKAMGETIRLIETTSYMLVVIIGARLVWVKGRAFARTLQMLLVVPAPALVPAGAPLDVPVAFAAPDHADGHLHTHHERACHAHTHAGEAHGCAACRHSHGPDPGTVAGPGGWRRGFAAVVAVGLRPCSGAIIVLVFALAQGLYTAGVAATLVMGLGTAVTVATLATVAVAARGAATRLAAMRSGYGALAVRGLELAVAVLIVLFGVLLLMGYMATERMFGV